MGETTSKIKDKADKGREDGTPKTSKKSSSPSSLTASSSASTVTQHPSNASLDEMLSQQWPDPLDEALTPQEAPKTSNESKKGATRPKLKKGSKEVQRMPTVPEASESSRSSRSG